MMVAGRAGIPGRSPPLQIEMRCTDSQPEDSDILFSNTLEWVATPDNSPVQIAGFSRCPANVLKLVEKGFEFVVANAKVLYRHVVRDERFAVALLRMRAQLQVFG